MATFSVIVPTVGRASLIHALASIVAELEPGDEVLVDCNSDGDTGSSARNRLVRKASGSHLVFLDDDDEFVPGGLERMRRFAVDNPTRIGLFRMRAQSGDLIWRHPILEYGCSGSPTMLIPNIEGRLGTWRQTDLGNDWNFLEETIRLQSSPPVFVDEVVATVRPRGDFDSLLAELRYRLRLRSRLRRLLRR